MTKLMSIKDAKEKCPSLVLVCGEDLTNYRQMSYKISGLSSSHTLFFILTSLNLSLLVAIFCRLLITFPNSLESRLDWPPSN